MVASLRVVVADRRPHMRVFPPSKDGGFIEGRGKQSSLQNWGCRFHHRKMVASLRECGGTGMLSHLWCFHHRKMVASLRGVGVTRSTQHHRRRFHHRKMVASLRAAAWWA